MCSVVSVEAHFHIPDRQFDSVQLPVTGPESLGSLQVWA